MKRYPFWMIAGSVACSAGVRHVVVEVRVVVLGVDHAEHGVANTELSADRGSATRTAAPVAGRRPCR